MQELGAVDQAGAGEWRCGYGLSDCCAGEHRQTVAGRDQGQEGLKVGAVVGEGGAECVRASAARRAGSGAARSGASIQRASTRPSSAKPSAEPANGWLCGTATTSSVWLIGVV